MRAAEVNEPGREIASALNTELVELRKAVATALRYIDGEIVSGLRDGHHTREVAANIAEHQSRLLRAAVERTGPLLPDGTAGSSVCLKGGSSGE